MDRFSFKQIMILVCTLAGLFMLFIGLLVGNRSAVTTRVCEGDTPCTSYTVEVQNANIAGDALSGLAERIITGIKEAK